MRSASALVLLAVLVVAAACDGDGAFDVEDPPAVEVVPALGGRTFDRPVEVGAYPGGRFFVAEQPGLVWVVDADGANAGELLDLREVVALPRGEGLLSVVLEPGFEESGHLWAYYFAQGEPRTVLARFTVVEGEAGPRAALDSELVALELAQPGFNQNGGAIRFGPDGMLYLSLGDGSASIDPFRTGQDLGTVLGSVIRIDARAASAGEPYAVPADNPFVDVEGARPEIWAYGVRSPWRMAFDGETGELWLGDVGVSDFEEVNRVERGANLGWSVLEGTRCIRGHGDCEAPDLVPPVYQYAHEEGRCAVTGGVVYRGEAIPGLRGAYLFGDFCTGELFALDVSDTGEAARIARIDGAVVSFGLDARGEVMVVSYTGDVWRLDRR